MEYFERTEAFIKIEEQYAPMISSLIRKLHIYCDHESYRQIGKVALWQAWLRFDRNKGEFTPFAYKTMRGAMLDELAKEGRYTETFILSEGDHFEGLEAQAVEDKLPEWVETVVLKKAERKLLHELFVEDKAIRQLAELYGISVAGMKKRRARLLEKIRESESFQNRE